jgi:hypothetical protein
MKPQLENKVMSSLLLYIDNVLMTKGEAFNNLNTKFFKIPSRYQSFDCYSAPFKQFVEDSSISGASIMSGITVNGSAYTGAYHINYREGQIYFPLGAVSSSANVSGIYSIKEFNTYLTNSLEEEILFESKINYRPKFAQTFTGVGGNVETYPAIFIKNNGYTYKPFAFGGMENMLFNARMIIMGDSQFNVDAATSILMESFNKYIPLVSNSELPFNALGASHFNDGQSGQNKPGYNYNSLISGKIDQNSLFIKEVDCIRSIPSKDKDSVDKHANRDLYSSIVDYTLEFPRFI